MEQLDIYLKNDNINGAISECIRNNFIYLGNLLTDINYYYKKDNSLLFLESYIQLKRSLNNIKNDNIIFNSNDTISNDTIVINNNSNVNNSNDTIVINNINNNSNVNNSNDTIIINNIKNDNDSNVNDTIVINNIKNDNDTNVNDTIVINNIKNDNDSNVNDTIVINNIKKIKVRLECNWLNSQDICNLWNKMSMGNYTWNNIQITWEEDYDYLVIINSSNIDLNKIDRNKTILLRMEPYMKLNEYMWGTWSNPNPIYFIDIISYERNFNNIEWHLSKTYNQLLNENIIKTKNKELSTILSSKYKDPGQIKRIDFAKFLDSKNDIILDVYGDDKFLYKNYKGKLPYHCKDDGLFPYKYTFNCENHELTGYFTEKIIDAILSETLIFYHGCLDITAYIDSRAFVWIELSNFENDYQYIKKCINENLWEQRLPFIKAEKERILKQLQFFPRIEKIINDNNK